MTLPEQVKVNAYFDAESGYWERIYQTGDVQGEIYRDRAEAILNWVDSLQLPARAAVLEIGCGAGFLSVALARRGLSVCATDSVETMVDTARRHVADAGASEMIDLAVADVNHLPYETGSFDLVIAVGVVPWLERPEDAIQEMARVLSVGGHLIFTADNWARLNHLLDPWLHPAFGPFKPSVKAMLRRLGRRGTESLVQPTFHHRSQIDRMVEWAGLSISRTRTLGFGPFTILGRRVLPAGIAIPAHHQLQRLADRNIALFRATGSHYIVLATKTSPIGKMSNTRSSEASCGEASPCLERS